MKHHYTTKEAAEILECSLVWVWELSKKIDYKRVKGKHARYTIGEIIDMELISRNSLKIRDKLSKILIDLE